LFIFEILKNLLIFTVVTFVVTKVGSRIKNRKKIKLATN